MALPHPPLPLVFWSIKCKNKVRNSVQVVFACETADGSSGPALPSPGLLVQCSNEVHDMLCNQYGSFFSRVGALYVCIVYMYVTGREQAFTNIRQRSVISFLIIILSTKCIDLVLFSFVEAGGGAHGDEIVRLNVGKPSRFIIDFDKQRRGEVKRVLQSLLHFSYSSL